MDCLVLVNVHLYGFSVSEEDFPSTKTTATPESYDGINALTLAFYSGSTEVEKITQLRSDNSNYETFVCTQPVNINTTSAVDLEVTLERIISQLKIVSTDGKLANVTNVRMTLSAGGKSFNPSTGLATSDAGLVNTVGNSTAVGNHSISSTFFFLSSDEETLDVTIETLDALGITVCTQTVSDVPFKRNRVTKFSGPLYTNTGITGSFQLSTEWLSETTVNF